MSATYHVEMKLLITGGWFPVSKFDEEGPAREEILRGQKLLPHRQFQLVKVETTRTVL